MFGLFMGVDNSKVRGCFLLILLGVSSSQADDFLWIDKNYEKTPNYNFSRLDKTYSSQAEHDFSWVDEIYSFSTGDILLPIELNRSLKLLVQDIVPYKHNASKDVKINYPYPVNIGIYNSSAQVIGIFFITTYYLNEIEVRVNVEGEALKSVMLTSSCDRNILIDNSFKMGGYIDETLSHLTFIGGRYEFRLLLPFESYQSRMCWSVYPELEDFRFALKAWITNSIDESYPTSKTIYSDWVAF